MYIIIGASSFIGNYLYHYCKKENIEVLGTFYNNCRNKQLVYFNIMQDSISDLFNKYFLKNVSAIIFCGANTSIDSCKKNQELSNQLNVVGMTRLLKEADMLGIKSVFLSSEAVFDGKKGMYREEDITNPITTYGRQKFQVEQYMIDNLSNYLIFRISRATDSRFGEKDIFHEFYTKITNNQEIVCLKNQSFCLTHIEDIVRGIVESIRKELKGLYHLSSANYISRYQLADIYINKFFCGYEDLCEKEFKEISFLDNRHIYAGLNGEKITNLIDLNYQNLDTIIEKYSKSYQSILRGKE